jgi:hypothetical protein
MAVACPNKNMSEWKELAQRFGDNIAESLYYRNEGEIPSVQEAQAMLRGSKVGQFKGLVRHLQNTVSTDPIDLVSNMSRIVQKVGSDLYVVKGSKLSEKPTVGAEMEIHTPNIKFLKSINESVGPLFNLIKVNESSSSASLGNDVITDLRNGEFDSLQGLTYKNDATDDLKRDQILKDLSEQALNSNEERRGLESSIGKPIVDKIIKYNESLKPAEEKTDAKKVEDAIKASPVVFNNLTEDDKGNYVFFHYSNADLTKSGINPENFGKNTNVTGREEASRSVPASLYYTDSKVAEPGLGTYKHVVRVPKSEVYPFNSDPLNLYTEAEKRFKEQYPDRSFNPNEQIGWIGKVAAEKGYKMIVAEWGGLKKKALRAESINTLKPELIEKPLGGTYGANAIEPIGNEKFITNRKRYKSEITDKSATTDATVLNDYAPGTYKVEINQDVLNNIASKNADLKNKENVSDQKETLATNNDILNNKAPKYSKAYGDAQVASVNYNLINNLQKKFNIPYEIINDNTSDYRGKFENGKVTINAAKLNEYTALHEYLHPFTAAMQKDNPDLYNNLIQDLQSTEAGKKVIEEIKTKYPELGSKDQLDEALVSHLSQITQQDQIKAKPWYNRLMDWFRDLFGRNNVSISGLDMNMTLDDIANKIIDPTYSADLKHYAASNDMAAKYQKDNDTPEHSENFNRILDKIKNNLTLDINIPAKNKEQETRKYFSGRQLADIQANKNVYRAVNDYVTSAIINAKKINEKFDEFKTLYDGAGGNLSEDQRIKGAGVLAEMEQHVAIYNQSSFIIDAIKQENAEEYDDNFKLLKNRLDGDTSIINNYHEYGLKLMSDWLYPTMKKAIDNDIKSGNIQKMPGYAEYLAVKAKSPNIEEGDAIEQGVKTWLKGQMEHATSDIGFFNSYMTGVLNSKDAISQLTALSLKEEFAKNNSRLFKVKTSIQNAITKVTGKKIFTTNEQHKELYKGFVHQVDNWEKTGYDEDGNAKFDYVKRTAFHEPYRYDQFYKAKREMFEKLGFRPNKNDESAYASWQAKKDAWFDEHSVRIANDKGETIRTVPSDRYINPEYAKASSDPLFKELTKHYNDANGKLGKYQLKYGIVPQQEVEGGLLSGLSAKKGLKENVQGLKENLKTSLGSRLGDYYAQDIDGKEYKTIPIRWTHLVDEDRLNYNLGKTVGDFWESSSKYESAKNVEPLVRTLKNFIEGNSLLKIGERDAPEIDAKGGKRISNYVKNLTKTKDQPNINRQLVDFLNDTIYGETEKKSNIKSPFLNLKYLVYKKGDTSVNGKAHREYVYSLEDLKKKTGSESIENDHFTKGTEKDVNGYGVTLVRNDKILSVNKLGRKLNGLSATINLGVNVIAGASHLLRGVASNFIEATGGKYFSHPDWASAYKEYFKNLTNFSFMEDTRGGKGSKITQLLTHYGTFQGEFLDQFGKHIGEGVVNKLFKRSSLFFSIHGAEHMIQTTQMIAAMKHLKLADGKTSLFDAWEKGEDGYIKIKDGLKWDDTKDNEFKNLVQSINKDRGNYSDFDKAALSRLWWGKMIMMFRRHIFNGIKARWGASYVDYERGGATQGYYRSFITSLASEFNEFRLNGKFRKLSPDEAYYAKKTLADIGMFAMLAGVLVPAFKDKEEHPTGADDYLALFARRLQMDVSFFYNPLEWKKVIQNPVVTGSTIDKFADFFHQAATAPSEEYQKDGSSYSAGDSKLAHKASQLIPGYRIALNLQNPQDLLKFYDLQKPIGK